MAARVVRVGVAVELARQEADLALREVSCADQSREREKSSNCGRTRLRFLVQGVLPGVAETAGVCRQEAWFTRSGRVRG